MRYKTKLYISFIGTALCVSFIGIGMTYHTMKPRIFKNLQIKALTVATTTAAMIDADALKEVLRDQNPDSAPYKLLEEQLRKARDANRSPYIYLYYLYTFAPFPDGPKNSLINLVDPEENPNLVNLLGTIDTNPINADILKHIKNTFSPDYFITDWGRWVSGFAPVFDREGNYVATVDADISIKRYDHYLDRLKAMVFIGFIVSFTCAFLGAFFIGRKITASLHTLMYSASEIGQGHLDHTTSLKTGDEFEELAEEMNRMTQGLKERERLKLNFARYVSYQVMEKTLKSDEIAHLDGEEKKVTILFSDIRHFTLLSEQLSAEKVVALLNEYFEVMVDVIFRFNGTLDKFLGDGILVEFGAPFEDPEQEKHAVLAAIEMQKALADLRGKWQNQGKPALLMGIGVHTGIAIVGNIGTEKRLEYTAIGDTINTALALENATKQFQCPILLSQSTFDAVKGTFEIRSLGPLELPDKKASINIYGIYES